MKLTDLIDNIRFKGNPDNRQILNITYDSRKVRRGTLFVAIKGINSDGHDYILEAINNGAAAILSNGRSLHGLEVPVIQVRDPRECMSRIAANFYHHPSRTMTIVGVTGTNGKTSVTQLMKAILMEQGTPCGTLGTLGFTTPTGMHSTGFTTPESVEIQQILNTLKTGGIDHLIMEISSHALALHRVDDVDVDVAIFTNLTPEHLDFHSNMEQYFQAKQKLFQRLAAGKTAVLNLDDPVAENLRGSTRAKIITYGFGSEANLHPVEWNVTLNGIQAELSLFGLKIGIDSPLIGDFNLQNIMAAVAAAAALGIPVGVIETAIRKVRNIPGRLETVNLQVPGRVIVDYAHTPDAYEKVISLVRDLSSNNKKIITLFGCGGDRDQSKRPVMAGIAERLSDFVYVTSDNPRTENPDEIFQHILSGFKSSRHQLIKDRAEAIRTAMQRMDEDTILLILGKGREEYEIIGHEKRPHSDIKTAEKFTG
ncbi:MAG: UDP-N-acetylmuramoyl-L-alanyl-D-glutamate--2,6-diaminopimelate ligase [FCB group bacterium]|nr:UDP-N-acetylmuramoyl-L-alanyl-D-glutamate--2,6-diaminopimelate ligase [FCB group bacterium]